MLTEVFARKPFVWMLGNHPPRKCGIATFTSDLADAIEANGTPCRVAAMDDGSGGEYPERVELLIGEHDLASYIEAAEHINRSKASAVFIQHEFGIFGGEAGSHIVTLLRFLELPVITTLHTVLDKPTEAQRWIIEEILSKSERVVVMSQKAKAILRRSYGRDDNVIVIPHGVPACPAIGPSSAKRELGWEGREVILTFGLLSPDKGIETMIRALAQIKAKHPRALYVVAGQTHPHIRRAQGEAYRESLQNLSKELGLEDSIQFIDRFTELNELCTMLTACDLYVTPYRKMEQITSGTLSYAVGLGKCVVSTPYWHAEELLSQGPGRLVDVDDVNGFAITVSELLVDHEARHMHEAEARRIGQAVRWPRIGSEYLRVVADIWEPVHLPPLVSGSASRSGPTGASLTRHLENMVDDTGLFQHSIHDLPNRREGYCTDDCIRALEVVWDAPSKAFSADEKERIERVCLSFVHYAWNPDANSFRNFMSYDRKWLEDAGSLDCQGRCWVALSKGAQAASTEDRRSLCEELFSLSWPRTPQVHFSRPCAHLLRAAAIRVSHVPGRADDVAPAAERAADRLMQMFQEESSADWPWFEPMLSYDNARIPEGLLAWSTVSGSELQREAALEALSWLCKVQLQDSYFAPIGNQGFWRRGSKRAFFDQQAIEAWATIDACLLAHRVTGSREWIDHAELALNWFYGRNALGALLVDSETGACADGLERHGPSRNRGAESCLAFLGSMFAMGKVAHERLSTAKPAMVL